MAKLKVGVLYGGRSGEHDVSVMSASSVMEELDHDAYDVTPVFIDRDGRWDIPLDRLRDFDVVFPVLHGPNGEDGTVQGLLSVLGVPFVGAGVVGSAVGMDKAIFKDVMRAHGLPVAEHFVVRRHEWERAPEAVRVRAAEAIGYPLFTKPANMGSSVGIVKVRAEQEFDAAMGESFAWDRKVLVEWAIPRARELEVSVLGNDDLRASQVGEIIPSREFYDYSAKYLDKGEHESRLLIPARLSEAESEAIRRMAVEVSSLADVRGMARVDFLMDGLTGRTYVNEINTIPGFTSISMYPKLWIASGLTYPGLLDRLIQLALESVEPARVA